ncbi:hypothetical protein ACTFIT_001472 [Dictyostelium discoideum]
MVQVQLLTNQLFNIQQLKYECIDFSNLAYYYDENNEYEQYLPNIDNSPLLTGIYIYQSVKKLLYLNYNQLNGTVPSCIQCLGGNKGGDMVLPNPFLNFNKTTEPYFPNFN